MSEEPQIGHNSGSNAPQTLAWEPLDSEHILACPRVPVSRVMSKLWNKLRWFDQIREKAPRTCCHNTDNLDIEAWYSRQSEKDKGVPDIYKIYCRVCEANELPSCHAKFCIGGTHALASKINPTNDPKIMREHSHLYDVRPFWDIR